MVRLLQPVAAHRPGAQFHDRPGSGPAQPRGDPLRGTSLVIGSAEYVLGDDVGTAAGGQHRRLRSVGGVDGNIHRRVTHTQHDDVSVLQLRFMLVGMGVDLFSSELLGPGEPRIWPAGVPVVTIGYADVSVSARLSGVQPDGESTVVAPAHMLHRGPEGDEVPQFEVVHIALEIGGDLIMAREVRQVLGHRKVGKLHPLPGGVDVQGVVGGRDTVVVAPYPVSADPV